MVLAEQPAPHPGSGPEAADISKFQEEQGQSRSPKLTGQKAGQGERRAERDASPTLSAMEGGQKHAQTQNVNNGKNEVKGK